MKTIIKEPNTVRFFNPFIFTISIETPEELGNLWIRLDLLRERVDQVNNDKFKANGQGEPLWQVLNEKALDFGLKSSY